jgi:hypothetical protein
MAIALIACITLRLKLVGLLGSFFRKKYIYKYKEEKAQSKKLKTKSRRGKLEIRKQKPLDFKLSAFRFFMATKKASRLTESL